MNDTILLCIFENPVKKQKHIPLSAPDLDPVPDEFDWQVDDKSQISGFEKDLSKLARVPYVTTTQSGTAAIHLALILLEIGQGDEVICQSFTFAGTAFPILYQGASPVFIDSERDSWNMDPELLEEAIIDRKRITGRFPKAIIPVHLFGSPAKMDEILSIASKYEIPVVEDAAEALGSVYQDQACGSFGDLGIYSFNSNKIITTSGGGAILSRNNNLIEKARYLANQAKDPGDHLEHKSLGFNYRMSHINAGIGRIQIKVLDDRIKKRRSIFDFYRERLKEIPGLTFQPELPQAFSNRWLSVVEIDGLDVKKNNELRSLLKNEGIEVSVVYVLY